MRLIDADALLWEKNTEAYKAIRGNYAGVNDLMEIVMDAPTIEAQPVAHGKWIEGDTFTPSYRCSCCGYSIFEVAGENIIQPKRNYCPNCGAKMKED